MNAHKELEQKLDAITSQLSFTLPMSQFEKLASERNRIIVKLASYHNNYRDDVRCTNIVIIS